MKRINRLYRLRYSTLTIRQFYSISTYHICKEFMSHLSIMNIHTHIKTDDDLQMSVYGQKSLSIPSQQSQAKTCYISTFYDIQRADWDNKFARTFEDYLDSFQPIINLFINNRDDRFEMVVYIDSRHFEAVNNKVKDISSIKLISIDNDFMKVNIPMWTTLDREREIMNSTEFKELIPHRLIYPEHSVPEYSLINHCKIDFIGYTIDANISSADYFAWVDFGYCKTPQSIPKTFLDLSKLDLNKVNYTLVNQIDIRDSNILYTLLNAPERIGGFFFFGSRTVLKTYQALYHKMLESFQVKGIADDDQALALACYWSHPDMFHLHGPFGWHQALTRFA